MINRFRVWDKDEGKYVKDASSLMLSIGDTDDGDFQLNSLCPGRYIIEQDTGLKDRNGERIREGDIVLDYYDGDDAYIVEWDKDTAGLILTGTDNIASVSFDNFYPDADLDLEVIGNIHENPELLGGKE